MLHPELNQIKTRIDKDKTNVVAKEPHLFAKAEMPRGLEKKEYTAKIHKNKTEQFRQYYLQKSRKIFQPDEYEYYLQGRQPKQSPLLAGLHDFHKSSYLTPLPAAAYERQIDVDNKYVREGQYMYGAQ
jgi:hypothetical protein